MKNQRRQVLNSSELPTISIVTPSYNQRQFLETAIKSVTEQAYPNLEYIVMDGHSTDDSQQILQKHSKKIDYWCSEPDEGQSDAIAKGFARAKGEILGWINSDDAFFPNALMKVGEYFAARPDIDLVLGGTAYTDQDGRVTSCYERPKPLMWFARHGITYFGQQGMFFRRKLYEEIGGIRRDFHFLMDTELLYRILQAQAKCGALRGMCGFFRWHSAMKSIRRQGRKAEERRIMQKEYGFGEPEYAQGLFHMLYRSWQVVNGNYMLSLAKTAKLRGKSIDQIWGWIPE